MSNNTQNANYWFNSFIITIADGVVKSTRKHTGPLTSDLSNIRARRTRDMDPLTPIGLSRPNDRRFPKPAE